jgi:hypothetical protein
MECNIKLERAIDVGKPVPSADVDDQVTTTQSVEIGAAAAG